MKEHKKKLKTERVNGEIMNEYLSDKTIGYPVDVVESGDKTVQYVEPVRERSTLANLHRLKAKKRAIQTLRKKQSKLETEIVKTVPAQKNQKWLG